jgi:hypothetical protein
MIYCSNCHHQEILGSLFCSECGSRLMIFESEETIHIKNFDKESGQAGMNTGQNNSEDPNPEPGASSFFSFSILEFGKEIKIPKNSECTLGRFNEGQPILPDIDLTEYDARAKGVSRLHAVIKGSEMNLTITDLESSNGTFVNGQKLKPYTDFPIKQGDILSLGKLKMQVLLH